MKVKFECKPTMCGPGRSKSMSASMKSAFARYSCPMLGREERLGRSTSPKGALFRFLSLFGRDEATRFVCSSLIA